MTHPFIMKNGKYIGSWASNPCEDVTFEQALIDIRIICNRPDEFNEDTLDNAFDTVECRFGVVQERVMEML